MSRYIVVASYSFPYEAQIAKARLVSAGIPVFLENEHTINMDWLYSNALGGIRVCVPTPYAAQAKAWLSEDFSADVDEALGIEPDTCPQCHSADLHAYTQGKKPAFIVFLLLGFPLFFYKHGVRCNHCGFVINSSDK